METEANATSIKITGFSPLKSNDSINESLKSLHLLYKELKKFDYPSEILVEILKKVEKDAEIVEIKEGKEIKEIRFSSTIATTACGNYARLFLEEKILILFPWFPCKENQKIELFVDKKAEIKTEDINKLKVLLGKISFKIKEKIK